MGFLDNLFGPPIPSIGPEELNQKWSGSEQLFLLDVREREEYQAGHIPGAAWIPLGELKRRLNEIPKEKEVVCVCQSGSRSLSATRLLLAAGLKAVNLKNGMMVWEMAGLPVSKGMAK